MKTTVREQSQHCSFACSAEHGGRLRNRLAAEDRRSEILKEALSCMTQSDQGEVPLSSIALRLGISRNLVYHYFPNQTSLVSAVLDQAFAEFLDCLRRVREKRQKRTAALVGVYAQFLLRRPEVARVLQLSTKSGGLFRSKTAQKQKVLVDSLLDAYAEDVGCKSLREVDAMRHAAEAAVEFVRLFAVLEAGCSTLSQSQVEQYCTGVVLHSLQEAEKLCLTDSTRTSDFDRI